jgi:hypothetical protein
MRPAPPPKDFVVLTADKNAQFAVRGILSRYRSLGIRRVDPDYLLHPGKDPGVLHSAHEFLRTFAKLYTYALVLMDREGSGQEAVLRADMEARIEEALGKSGWNDRATAIVIDPELDIWAWSDSPHVDHELGWSKRQPDLRTWLTEQGLLKTGAVKPDRPKEALEAALREVRKPRSSALYQALAEKVSLERCTDLAFEKLKTALQRWFSATGYSS